MKSLNYHLLIKTLAVVVYLLPLTLSAQHKERQNIQDMDQENRTTTAHDITLSTAQKLINHGLLLAKERKLGLSIAVVDRSGNLVAFARTDAATLITIDVALGKAKTAAYLKAPSKIFEDFINSGQPSMATTPGILPLQGGVPIIYKEEIIGGVGVSGSNGETDNEIATLIAQYINIQNK